MNFVDEAIGKFGELEPEISIINMLKTKMAWENKIMQHIRLKFVQSVCQFPSSSAQSAGNNQYDNFLEHLYLGNIETISKAKKALSKEQFKRYCSRFLFEFVDEEHEGETVILNRDNRVIQRKMFRYPLDENKENYLLEIVDNHIFENGTNIASAYLLIENRDERIYLNLGILLPDNWYFSPDELSVHGETISMFSQEKRNHFVDLSAYNGAGRSNGNFHTWSLKGYEANFIHYGNLKERGGILALFHEIAHAWQFGLSDYTIDLEKICNVFSDLMFFLGDSKINSINLHQDHEFPKELLEKSLSNMKIALGLDEKCFEEYDQDHRDNEAIITHRLSGKKFIVKDVNGRFNWLLHKWEKEERLAWAHAIHTLRILRCKYGIDLMPEMTTVDIKRYIHKALSTYQDGIGNIIEFSSRKAKFV